MTVIVFLAFAAHVIAWIALPDRKVGVKHEPSGVMVGVAAA
jgi:hypothetical protein